MTWEYFCERYHQLRFFPSPRKPTICATCNSTSIDIDEPGSERLKRRRYADRTPDGKYTVIVVKPK